MLQEAQLVIRLNPADDVVIARRQLVAGTLVKSEGVTVIGMVPPGHKLATRAIASGGPVRRYNQIIGFATRDIRPGEHVHLHNLGIGAEHGANVGQAARDYAFCADVHPTPSVATPATFMGIVRPDGRVATRNYVAILSSVNCSATVSRAIADRFRRDIFPDALGPYPNVDGVIALTHGTGCGMDMGESMDVLRRTMAGYARHPNVAAVIFIGLGPNNRDLSHRPVRYPCFGAVQHPSIGNPSSSCQHTAGIRAMVRLSQSKAPDYLAGSHLR
jgi:altronate hydrolase